MIPKVQQERLQIVLTIRSRPYYKAYYSNLMKDKMAYDVLYIYEHDRESYID